MIEKQQRKRKHARSTRELDPSRRSRFSRPPRTRVSGVLRLPPSVVVVVVVVCTNYIIYFFCRATRQRLFSLLFVKSETFWSGFFKKKRPIPHVRKHISPLKRELLLHRTEDEAKKCSAAVSRITSGRHYSSDDDMLY